MDQGYRGHGYNGFTKILMVRQKRGITPQQKKRLKRRNSIEPIIGHMKNDGKLGRCHLKGQRGDAINVILCAAGQNIRKRLRWLYFAWLWLMPEAVLRLEAAIKQDERVAEPHLHSAI